MSYNKTQVENHRVPMRAGSVNIQTFGPILTSTSKKNKIKRQFFLGGGVGVVKVNLNHGPQTNYFPVKPNC